MRIYLNTKEYETEDGITVNELLRTLHKDSKKNMVSVDRRFIPQSELATFVLREGCMVDIVPGI
ncbi:MAG: MoaD/ThiS family protein [Muribaculaceae bacterium]|nr:MoaD/ThiS family protein [Muribaculaceae bacterium]